MQQRARESEHFGVNEENEKPRQRRVMRTRHEIREAKQRVKVERCAVSARATDGNSVTRIAADYHVPRAWLAAQLDVWKVPRRSPYATPKLPEQ
jgi:hypothetical protein